MERNAGNLGFTKSEIEKLNSIIQAGGLSGVKSLKFGQFEIEYYNKEERPENVEDTTHVNDALRYATADISQESSESQSQSGIPVSEDLATYEQDLILQEDYENLYLEDPERFEELLAMGKLNEYGSPSAEL